MSCLSRKKREKNRKKKNPQTPIVTGVCELFKAWCRWWDLNPHVVANKGF